MVWVRLHNKTNYRYGFVQFQSPAVAASVLFQSIHWISNSRVKAKPAHSRCQDYMAPEQDSDAHILNALNDDCLRAIFKRLNLIDLTNAAGVCVRFKEHAEIAFKAKHSKLEITNAVFSRRVAKAVLQNFGKLIRSLNVESMMLGPDHEAFTLMHQHTGTALTEFQLSDFDFRMKNNLQNAVFSLLSKVKLLTLYECEFHGKLKDMLAICNQLNTLRMIGGNWNGNAINSHFPQLKEAEFTENMGTLNDARFNQFTELNPQLEKLTIGDNGDFTSKSIHSIGMNLLHLIELEIDEEFSDDSNFHKHSETLARLNSLKVLKLKLNGNSATPLLRALANQNVPIEHLKFEEGSIDMDGIKHLSQLKKMKHFTVNEVYGLTDKNVVQLAMEWPEIETLCFGSKESCNITTVALKNMVKHAKKLSDLTLNGSMHSCSIGASDYEALLKMVKNRREQDQLTIKITSTGDSVVNVPDSILSENRKWLTIEEFNAELTDISYDSDDFEQDDWYDSDDSDDIMGGFALNAVLFALHFGGRDSASEDNDDEDENDDDDNENENESCCCPKNCIEVHHSDLD